MSIKTDNRVITIMALLGAMVLWASSFVALKYAFMSYDSMVVIFTRMLITLIFVLIFWGGIVMNFAIFHTLLATNNPQYG